MKLNQKTKIYNYLTRHGAATPAKIAHETKIPILSVYKRMYDLREEFTVTTTQKTVNGQRKTYYSLAV